MSLTPQTPRDDFTIWWRAMVLAVFATDWSTVTLGTPSDDSVTSQQRPCRSAGGGTRPGG